VRMLRQAVPQQLVLFHGKTVAGRQGKHEAVTVKGLHASIVSQALR
jgi:hypothetical protein